MPFPLETFQTFKIGLMKKVVHIQFVYFKVIGVLLFYYLAGHNAVIFKGLCHYSEIFY